jgi:hypothetical protein
VTAPSAFPGSFNASAWLRVSTFFNNPAAPSSLDRVYADGLLQLMFNGRVHRYVGWQADVFANYGGGDGTMASSVGLLDLIIKLEPIDHLVNLWLGRMLVPSDRANFSAPWSAVPWLSPGLFEGPHGPGVGPRQGPRGRNDGATVWGQIGGGVLKYYVGTFDLFTATARPLISARVDVSLFNPQPGYYEDSVYYGVNRVALGFNYQYQHDGSVSRAGVPSASADYNGASVDLLMEKTFGRFGVGTFEASFYRFLGDYESMQWSSFATLSYLMPSKLWIGQLQPTVRYQQASPRKAGVRDDVSIDGQLGYVIDKDTARVALGATWTETEAGPRRVLFLGVQVMH